MSSKDLDLLKKFFAQNNGVNFIRLHWVDYSGVLRTRIIPRARSIRLATGSDTYRLAQNCMICPISTSPRCFPLEVEDWTLYPDWTSLMLCGFAPTHASVMCVTAHKGTWTTTTLNPNPEHFARCPRTLLQTVLRNFYAEYPRFQDGLLLGFEIEFVLLDESSNLASSLDRMVGYSLTAGIRAENLVIIEEIVTALAHAGVEIYHLHTETTDQLEIALSPLAPVQAVDALMMAQETIRTICIRHGRRACTAPRPTLLSSGPLNGCHVHLSLNPVSGLKSPANVTEERQIKEDQEEQAISAGYASFLAGILRKTKALCAFGLANYDSYWRVLGDCAGEWIGWGTHNREFPVRGMRPNRWEIRYLDTTANVYLFVAALVASGMDGMKQTTPLTITDCPLVPQLYSPDEAERRLREYGITERMPKSLEVALKYAQEDGELRGWVGEELFAQYRRVKDIEIQYFSGMSDEVRRQKFLDYF